MRVCVIGATGFIGRALVPLLLREGHTVVAWARSAARARGLLGAEVECVEAVTGPEALAHVLERCDAVINLAGEPILGGRWTPARRALLRDSRVQGTEQLVRALAAANPRPRVLISGSAVGYYGDRADEQLSETSSPGDDFLARLCQAWEGAAHGAEALGIRVMQLRTGVVLGRDGGALAQMLPPFRLGAGGPIGSGRQYLPWIHLHDLVKIIAVALVDDRYRGPMNGVAPEEATSRDFARALGRQLHRPAVLPVPSIALRAIFGEAAAVLLGSQRVDPAALRERGFSFGFPTLASALADILGGVAVTFAGTAPYELRCTTIVNAPLDDTFAFFSKAENLGLITPAAMKFSIQGSAPSIAEGTTIDYHVRIGPVTVPWRSRIVDWEPRRRFVDVQEKGPYRSWSHEHTFRADADRTVMEDRVRYEPPFGLLGRLANRLFIVPTLRQVFQYRGDIIRLRFGAS